jgi:hypothetical protein
MQSKCDMWIYSFLSSKPIASSEESNSKVSKWFYMFDLCVMNIKYAEYISFGKNPCFCYRRIYFQTLCIAIRFN